MGLAESVWTWFNEIIDDLRDNLEHSVLANTVCVSYLFDSFN